MSDSGVRAAIGARTLAEAFRITAGGREGDVAIRTRGDEVTLTWGELRDRGDTVALMIGNRPEFHICDLAVMMLGGTPFSIYLTSSPEQIEYVVSDAGARVAIVEEPHLERVLAARAELPE